MGKQINFYLTADDSIQLAIAIRSSRNVKVVPAQIWGSSINSLRDINGGGIETEWLTVFLTRDVENLIVKPVHSQDYSLIDPLRSEVVEYSRCHFDGKNLRRGRMFYDAGFYSDDEQWKNKSLEFLEWADAILSCVRTVAKLDKRSRDYVGPEADRLRRESRIHFVQ